MGAFQEMFTPLQNRNLRIYLSGQVVSLVGTWMQMTAQSWVVWRLTNSTAALGVVGMLATLPFLVLGPIAGVWADRLDRRKILINTQAVAMVLAFILAALVQFDLVRIWHVYVLALALGCVNALDMPSQQAFIGDMAGMDVVRKAVVVNGMIVQVSRILGPTVAGWIVKAFGEGLAFWFNGFSFLAVIASLLAVRANQTRRPASQRPGNFMEGVRYLLTQPRMIDLMILTALITFFGFSNAQIMPAFVSRVLHGEADLYGTLMGASGVGAMFSVLFVVPIGQRVKRAGLMLGAAVSVAGLAFAAFSWTHSVPWAMVAYFLAGIPIPLVLTTNNGLLQVLAPNEMRARLLTIYLMFSFGLQPIANLWVGWLASHIGPAATIRVNGFSMVTVALLMLLRPDLRAWIPAIAPLGGRRAAGGAPVASGGPQQGSHHGAGNE